MRIFVVIVNFRSGKNLQQCLNSLSKIREKLEIIVIDNSRKNLGFAKGVNKGIQKALESGASHILILNPDVEVTPNFLSPLLAREADIAGPVLKFKRGGRWFFDLGGYVNLFLGRPKHKEVNKLRSKRPQKPDFVSGACMLVKKEVLRKIGLFDERFFLYFEDVDFCLRAKEKGFSVEVVPQSIVVHRLVEGKDKTLVKNFHLLKSNFLFISKHVSPLFWPFAYFYWSLLGIKIALT